MDAFETLIFHQLSKVGLFFLLALAWITFARESIAKWAENPKKGFPVISFTLMIFLSVGYFYYLGMEGAFRKVPGIQNPASVQAGGREILLEKDQDEWTAQETLEEKTQRMIEENRAENEEAKKRFLELGNIDKNPE
ncbi:MAG TPA: hypothetical protein PKA63_13450 [Oligoflexia bacterium]|nr:hypothetical protein [Oligoflexia bacterium]HMP49667.1 hypothetical protein [Oligoflexia bacterium]